MSTTLIQIEHNFETAHRLPFLGGKCTNLHGHSWRTQIAMYNSDFETGVSPLGVSFEFGLVKKVIRNWIDENLDHGAMLGEDDSLTEILIAEHSKVFTFGDGGDFDGCSWPTVEAVAKMLYVKLQGVLDVAIGKQLIIDNVVVQETSVNSAIYMGLV